MPGCGVTFEVVSNIPGVSEGVYTDARVMHKIENIKGTMTIIIARTTVIFQDAQSSEDREMLARIAANTENPKASDNEAAIEKYLRSVLAVENILTLDRLRQVN